MKDINVKVQDADMLRTYLLGLLNLGVGIFHQSGKLLVIVSLNTEKLHFFLLFF